MSFPAKVIVLGVVATGVFLAWLAFVLDTFSDDPSSTAVFVFPAMAFYIAVAVMAIAGIDWGIRWLARRTRDRSRSSSSGGS